MIKKLLLFFGLALVGAAQNNNNSINPADQKFAVTYTATLSTSTAVVTVQHGATWVSAGNVYTTKTVKFIKAYIYSATTLAFTIEKNGTLASSTAATINNLNAASTTANTTSSTAWTGSNVGTGTVYYTVEANTTIPYPLILDLSDFQLNGGTADNFTIRSASGSGIISITIIWQEL